MPSSGETVLPRSAVAIVASVVAPMVALSALLIAGCAAPGPTALADMAVDRTQTVAPGIYAEAARLAANGAAPVDIALRVTGPFEGRTLYLVQANEGAEAPVASRVTVLRDGLLDDAVRGDRWEIRLERTGPGPWRIADVQRAWRCRRGGNTDRFSVVNCP